MHDRGVIWEHARRPFQEIQRREGLEIGSAAIEILGEGMGHAHALGLVTRNEYNRGWLVLNCNTPIKPSRAME